MIWNLFPSLLPKSDTHCPQHFTRCYLEKISITFLNLCLYGQFISGCFRQFPAFSKISVVGPHKQWKLFGKLLRCRYRHWFKGLQFLIFKIFWKNCQNSLKFSQWGNHCFWGYNKWNKLLCVYFLFTRPVSTTFPQKNSQLLIACCQFGWIGLMVWWRVKTHTQGMSV